MDEADRLLSAEYRKAIRNDPCFYCGSAETHHVDHYFPLAKGGTDAWFNLRAACRDCNLSKFTTCGTAFLLRAGDLTRT
jgi:5-methylcytosine-specific restriction endonuclease McrA